MANRIINILYVSHYPHYRMGGQKSMLALIKNLDRNIINPFVLAPEDGELIEKAKELKCETFILPLYSLKPKNLFKILSTISKLIKIIEKNKIDIIHTDTERDAFIAGIVKYFTKVKLIWHSRLARPDNIDKMITKYADGIILISNDIKKRFKNFEIINHKTVTIFNGVFCDIFFPADKFNIREELKIDFKGFIVSFIGQFNQGKGIFDLLNAAKLLNNIDNDIQILFIGKASNEDELLKMNNFVKDNNLEKIVKIINHQNNIHKWMQASDTIILPSYEGVEGMGRVLIEGMACGKPVIGTNISGIKEAITTKTGILINEKSPQEIVDAILKLKNDNELFEKLSKNARLRAVDYFDIKIHSKNVVDFYLSIL